MKQIMAPFVIPSEAISELFVVLLAQPRGFLSLVLAADTTPLDHNRRSPTLLLRFDCDFGLHRISNETLLVRGMIYLLELLLSRLFFAGELQSLV